jgi:hypothetical protein
MEFPQWRVEKAADPGWTSDMAKPLFISTQAVVSSSSSAVRRRVTARGVSQTPDFQNASMHKSRFGLPTTQKTGALTVKSGDAFDQK